MKTSLTIVLVAAVMSVATTGYAKLFDDEQLGSVFQAEDTVFEISLKSSDILESAVQDREIAIRDGLTINPAEIINNELFGDTAPDSNSAFEDLEGYFEDLTFNTGRSLELKTVSDSAILAGTDSWANTDLLLCINELADSCNLLLLTVTR